MKKLIILADIKEYLPQLDREEITTSRFAEILNQLANERSRNYIISDFDAVKTLINKLEKQQTMKREELMHFANWLQVASWENMDVDFEDLVDYYIIENSQVTEPVPTDQDAINAMKKQLIDHGFKTYL
jgi:Ulp1 family protease